MCNTCASHSLGSLSNEPKAFGWKILGSSSILASIFFLFHSVIHLIVFSLVLFLSWWALSYAVGAEWSESKKKLEIYKQAKPLLPRQTMKGFLSKSYTMGCPLERGVNPRALASGLSYVQVDKHGITILYHLHQCGPCTSRDISC